MYRCCFSLAAHRRRSVQGRHSWWDSTATKMRWRDSNAGRNFGPIGSRAGDALKRTYVATIGTSREFNRMVDLDVRRRAVLIMLRDLRLEPERVEVVYVQL